MSQKEKFQAIVFCGERFPHEINAIISIIDICMHTRGSLTLYLYTECNVEQATRNINARVVMFIREYQLSALASALSKIYSSINDSEITIRSFHVRC